MAAKANVFSDRLKIVQGQRSQREFAKALNISPSTLWEYMQGRIPPVDVIARICECEGLSEKWLLSGKGEMHASPQSLNMSNGDISAKVFREIPEVDLPSIGLGTCRSSGTYIIALLQLENPGDRVSILVDAAKQLGITLGQIKEEYTDTMCPECGMSMAAHKQNGGECF